MLVCSRAGPFGRSIAVLVQEHCRFLKVGMLGQVHLLMIFCLLLGTALIYYVWKAKKEESA
jgi:hypothetical protein